MSATSPGIRLTRYQRMCAALLVRRGYNAGQSVKELARLSGRTEATVRRWLRLTGLTMIRRPAGGCGR